MWCRDRRGSGGVGVVVRGGAVGAMQSRCRARLVSANADRLYLSIEKGAI